MEGGGGGGVEKRLQRYCYIPAEFIARNTRQVGAGSKFKHKVH